MPLRSWLGNLLAPAERPTARPAASETSSEALLAGLRGSRQELAALRRQLGADSGVAKGLEAEELLLVEAEANLLTAMDERKAREAVLRARRRATEAELLAEL